MGGILIGMEEWEGTFVMLDALGLGNGRLWRNCGCVSG